MTTALRVKRFKRKPIRNNRKETLGPFGLFSVRQTMVSLFRWIKSQTVVFANAGTCKSFAKSIFDVIFSGRREDDNKKAAKNSANLIQHQRAKSYKKSYLEICYFLVLTQNNLSLKFITIFITYFIQHTQKHT